jgi:hypothetical protein
MKKILSILIIQGNTNQSCTENLSHSSQNGYHQENKEQQMLARMWRKGNPYTLLVGM